LEQTRLTQENISALYRFALLLKGEEEAALTILLETLRESAPDLIQLRNDRNRLAFALKKLRAACLKSSPSSASIHSADSTGLTQEFMTLPEPERSVLALHDLKLFSAKDTATLLDLSLKSFSVILKNAQAQFPAPAEPMDLDADRLKRISSIKLPPDLESQFSTEEEPTHQGIRLKEAWKHPPILAVIIALMVILGWLIFSTLLRSDNFPGHEVTEQLINATNEMDGTELNPKATEVGLLGDWLFSQYGFENYFVPESLAHLKTAGCRVFKLNGVPVAQIAIHEQSSFLFLFHAEDLGVNITPPDQWRLFRIDDWIVAIQTHQAECAMVAFHGTKNEMRHFLGDIHD